MKLKRMKRTKRKIMKLKRMKRTKRKIMKLKRMKRTKRKVMKQGGGDVCCREPEPKGPKALPSKTTKESWRLKFNRVGVLGDGHCLYRAIASGLNHKLAAMPRDSYGIVLDRGARDTEAAEAISLRLRAATYLKENRYDFPTILEDDWPERLSGIRGDMQKKDKRGTKILDAYGNAVMHYEWGGQEEIRALSLVLKQPITTHHDRDGAKHEYGKEQGGETINLRYVSAADSYGQEAVPEELTEVAGHYELLVPKVK